jgi:FkbM family methyltransferase
MLSTAWLAYRRLRAAAFTIAGKNPIAKGDAAVPFEKDRAIAKILNDLRTSPPVQIRTDAEGRSLWQTSVGELWAPPGADGHYMRLIEAEARSDVYYLSECPLAGATFLDCGANIGIISRSALRLGVARVVCFEPSPATAECLRMNFAAEIGSGVVTVVEKALWNEESRLFLKTERVGNPASHSLSGTTESGVGVWVPVTTIDKVVAELGLSRVDFIKMDIEGAEVKALEGARSTIQRDLPYIALGTEHTNDLHVNNMQVIEAIQAADTSYRYICTEVHPHRSPSKGLVLTPHSVFFYPHGAGKRGFRKKPASA